MISIAVGTPIVGPPTMAYAFSLAELILWFAQTQVLPEDRGQAIRLLRPTDSCVLSANREEMTEQFLQTDCTHMLFIDGDMWFEPQAVGWLISRRHPLVGCNYSVKNKAHRQFTSTGLNGKRIHTSEKKTGLEPCLFFGFGLSLIERRVFEAIEMPRYPIGFNLQTKKYTTEDYPFCKKAKEAGFQSYIDHDASKLVKHVGNYPYCWDEVPEETGDNDCQSEPCGDWMREEVESGKRS